MTTQTAKLTAKKRDRLGSRYARRVREAGGLPAALYGHGEAPVALTIDAKEASGRLAAGTKVFTLEMEGAGTQTALVKEIQFDYLGDTIIHVDFARVDLDEQVEVHVPVRLKGEAAGLKHAGAVLLHPVSDLLVRCAVTAIPEGIEVSIAHLEVDHAVYVREVAAPAGVTILTDPDSVVATIHMKVEEVAAEAAPAEGEAAQPEVIREKKPEEGEAAEGAAKPGAKAAAPAKEAKGEKKDKK
jgi:large subunit ribosomal protein L25